MQLPKQINYQRKSDLPRGTSCLSAIISPSNGAVFSDSQLIQFQLPTRGYLVPESIYLRYKTSYFNGGTAYTASQQRGSFPAFSPFQRLETVVGAATVESISNYGQMCQMLLTCKMNYAQKIGLAYALGIEQGADLNSSNANSRTIAAAGAVNAVGDSWTSAIPLNCLFANCENLVPLKFMPTSVIQLYTDTLTNIMYSSGATAPSKYELSNLELCFDIIDFNEETDMIVKSMVSPDGMLTIKSQSYLSSGQTTAAISAGSLEFIYSMRLASIKSLFLILAGTHANSVNKNFDSIDITTSGNTNTITSTGGAYQFFISSTPYPSRNLSTVLNRAGILAELGAAVGSSAQDISQYNFSIQPVEFKYGNTCTTTISQPSKFFVGVNTERLLTNSSLLTGVSSQNSPISVRIDINTATTNSQVLNLVANFDAILEIDVANRQCRVLV